MLTACSIEVAFHSLSLASEARDVVLSAAGRMKYGTARVKLLRISFFQSFQYTFMLFSLSIRRSTCKKKKSLAS